MTAFTALETRLGAELAQFSRLLWARRLPHRVLDAPDGRQVVIVAREEHVALVQELFERWRSGEIRPEDIARPAGGGAVQRAWRVYPVTLAVIALAVAGAALVYLDRKLALLGWLTFTGIELAGNRLQFAGVAETYASGQYWRLLTPVFLHFGLLHAAFNVLWYWELGRRVERARGMPAALAVLVITGAGGNIAQYIVGGSVLFGGLSGVIYGLLGYSWSWTRLSGDTSLALPRAILVFMLAWLLVCMSGLVEALGFGAVANAAHAAGLALGVLLGAAAALLYSPPPADRL